MRTRKDETAVGSLLGRDGDLWASTTCWEHGLGGGRSVRREIRYQESNGRLQEGTIVDASMHSGALVTRIDTSRELQTPDAGWPRSNDRHLRLMQGGYSVCRRQPSGRVSASMSHAICACTDRLSRTGFLHGAESTTVADAGYQGVDKRPGNRGGCGAGVRPGQGEEAAPEGPGRHGPEQRQSFLPVTTAILAGP